MHLNLRIVNPSTPRPAGWAEGSACLPQAGVDPERHLLPHIKGQGLSVLEWVNIQTSCFLLTFQLDPVK